MVAWSTPAAMCVLPSGSVASTSSSAGPMRAARPLAFREGTVTPNATSSFNETSVIAAKWDGGRQIAT